MNIISRNFNKTVTKGFSKNRKNLNKKRAAKKVTIPGTIRVINELNDSNHWVINDILRI